MDKELLMGVLDIAKDLEELSSRKQVLYVNVQGIDPEDVEAYINDFREKYVTADEVIPITGEEAETFLETIPGVVMLDGIMSTAERIVQFLQRHGR